MSSLWDEKAKTLLKSSVILIKLKFLLNSNEDGRSRRSSFLFPTVLGYRHNQGRPFSLQRLCPEPQDPTMRSNFRALTILITIFHAFYAIFGILSSWRVDCRGFQLFSLFGSKVIAGWSFFTLCPFSPSSSFLSSMFMTYLDSSRQGESNDINWVSVALSVPKLCWLENMKFASSVWHTFGL